MCSTRPLLRSKVTQHGSEAERTVLRRSESLVLLATLAEKGASGLRSVEARGVEGTIGGSFGVICQGFQLYLPVCIGFVSGGNHALWN